MIARLSFSIVAPILAFGLNGSAAFGIVVSPVKGVLKRRCLIASIN
jgi:hypothetical protein